MSRPTVAQVRAVANPILTNMLVAFRNEEQSYIAGKAVPVVPVAESSGTYFKFTKKFWFADQLERRAYGDDYNRGGYEMETDTYTTEQWGIEHLIPDELRSESQLPLTLESLGVEWLNMQAAIRLEADFASNFFAASVWTSEDLNSATDWDSTGTPVTDAETARRTVRQLTGRAVDSLAMGEIVWSGLLINSQIVDLMKYTNSQNHAQRSALVASVMGVENLYVSQAVHNTANLGQDISLSAIMDDDALFFIKGQGTDMNTVSSFKRFTWQAGGGEGQIMSYRSDENDSDVLKYKEQGDFKLVSADTGYFFQDIV